MATEPSQPVLYSFRRCPYAMRARMGLHSANIELEHREILLKNKPPSMLAASAKGTVPVLILPDQILDESWDVLLWALQQSDPDNLLGDNQCHLPATDALVAQCDGPFKQALDCYKYADRHPEPAETYRQQGMEFLSYLEQQLQNQNFLLGDKLSIADIAVMPFIRQFAHVDLPWFEQCGLPHVNNWLKQMLESDLFRAIMVKHPLWQFEAP